MYQWICDDCPRRRPRGLVHWPLNGKGEKGKVTGKVVSMENERGGLGKGEKREEKKERRYEERRGKRKHLQITCKCDIYSESEP